MKTFKTLGIAGGLLAAALVGGTLISAASAAPSNSVGGAATLADDTDLARYCAIWQETFADELGVSVADLVPAGKAASIAAVNAAIEAGDLPAEVGARIIARIEAAEGDGCRLLGGAFHWAGRHAARAEARHDLVTAAAEALGMEPVELVQALRDGDSLKQIAQDQGVDYDLVSQTVLDAAKTNLDALVEAGTITQQRADAMLDNLDQALQTGTWPPMPGDGTMQGRFGFGGMGDGIRDRLHDGSGGGQGS
jgi:hypothetical protein